MIYPQLLIYETHGLYAARLRPLAEEHQWLLREPRRRDACIRLLQKPHPAVLVIQVDSEVIDSMRLLQQIHAQCPRTAAVIVGEVRNDALAALAWHFGARCVLLPPQPRHLLPTVIMGLMKAALDQRQAAAPATIEEIPTAEPE